MRSRIVGVRKRAGRGPLEGLRVLVVEDRRELRELFATLFAHDGAMVVQAATGSEAIELASAWAFDVVQTDLGLPDISGEIVVRHVVGVATTPLTVIVVTGHDEPHLARVRAAGADAVFQKPVEWEHIVAYLRRCRSARTA
jgi:CheY-like chemotaxis protein